jgi:hypothetical protein
MPMPLSRMVMVLASLSTLTLIFSSDRFRTGRVGQGLEAQLVGGIARVRDQFAQEDFLVAVQGMDHQVQQLLHLGLEAQGFLGRGFGHVEISPVENSDLNGDQRRRFKRAKRRSELQLAIVDSSRAGARSYNGYSARSSGAGRPIR